MMSCRENLQKCHEYVRALEEERRKIQMFEKELPLCLEIITQAIESCKLQLPGTVGTATTTTTTTDCSEQTTSDGLVFEEFIPITREGEEEDNSQLESHKNDKSQKSDWLRSAQLWNQSADPPTREEEEGEKNSRLQVRKVSVVEVTQSNPTEIIVTPTSAVSEMEAAAAPLEAPAGSSCSSGSKRKSRRCWSLELHRRFLNALEQLGGPHVATPKQIRKLMKVDGLTNDEVKSHLQKYRLHSTRRPTTSHHNSINSNSTQAGPQFVVVGGIWVPPSNTSSMDGVTTGGASGVVYAPLGQQQPRHQVADIDINDNNINKGGRCNSSPANSSSARAATASPAC